MNPGNDLQKPAPEKAEDFFLQFQDGFLGIQYLKFVLLQVLGYVPLSVYQSLFARIMGRYLFLMGLGDLYVVTEDPIVADFEVRYSCYLPFTSFYPGNPFLAVVADRPELIQLLVVAFADNSSILESRRRRIDQKPKR